MLSWQELSKEITQEGEWEQIARTVEEITRLQIEERAEEMIKILDTMTTAMLYDTPERPSFS